LGGDVLREHQRTLGAQPVGASSFLRFKGNDQSSALEAGKHLIQRAGRKMHSREFFDVFHERVAVLVTSRETRKYEYGGPSVASEANQSVIGIGHRLTISISDLSVKDIMVVATQRRST
jgi:hypothetical protein